MTGDGASIRFVFVSSCPDEWGGSEELWAGAVRWLAQAGHQVHVYKTNVNPRHPRITALRAVSRTVTDLHQRLPWPVRLRNRLLPHRWAYKADRSLLTLQQALQRIRPHLTIVAQGNNFDGAKFANVCRQHGHPYVLIAQKAVHFFYPYDSERSLIQRVYQSALRCFFVARHNLELTRYQLGMPLPNAEVVFNPVNVPYTNDAEHPYPPVSDAFRLACVARLDVLDKGQDILLDVLAQPKWRGRPLHVTFFGTGPHRQALEGMARFLDLTQQVHFAGYVASPVTIWQTHHALVLPSRSEGLPLALVEAMICGRPAIATDAGGIAELLVDNQTGFLAVTPSVNAFDEALERAWNRRADWPRLGAQAARHARSVVPADAVEQFSQQLLRQAYAAEPVNLLPL